MGLKVFIPTAGMGQRPGALPPSNLLLSSQGSRSRADNEMNQIEICPISGRMELLYPNTINNFVHANFNESEPYGL